ncbi:MAG: GPP34 family phosphoprotein, partial [Rhodospirillaceae bacterium]|nr:GPP34 family phosphoprotein [Rhodospirillaceae bacterium]
MADTIQGLAAQSLNLPEELILMLLNEETGYFHQVQGWELNCAIVGAVLAELSLLERIDTDMESLLLVDQTETGNPILDPILKQVADEPNQRNAQFWIERLAGQAETVIDSTLDHLVALGILKHHDGDFWTLAPVQYGSSLEDTPNEFIKARISKFIYSSVIP